MSEQDKERVGLEPVDGAEEAIERTKDDSDDDSDFEGHRLVPGDDSKERVTPRHEEI